MAAGKHPPAWSRVFRRLWRPFLDKAEKELISRAIAEMEAKTTAEIHVHVAGRVGPADILALAENKFHELGLDKTERRNGVLILISDLDHRFAIWGDKGIHEKAGQELWEKAKQDLVSHFAERRYPEGIVACVREVGRALAVHFPKAGPDANELPDEISES